jgi:hypothetical protein
MQHATLENGRWAELTFPQQMANIGSETSRILKALEAGKESRAEGAFARAQELIDLTIKYGRVDTPSQRSALWKELCRFREVFCAAFLSRDLTELLSLNKYLDQFALIRQSE